MIKERKGGREGQEEWERKLEEGKKWGFKKGGREEGGGGEGEGCRKGVSRREGKMKEDREKME